MVDLGEPSIPFLIFKYRLNENLLLIILGFVNHEVRRQPLGFGDLGVRDEDYNYAVLPSLVAALCSMHKSHKCYLKAISLNPRIV